MNISVSPTRMDGGEGVGGEGAETALVSDSKDALNCRLDSKEVEQ